MSSLANTQDETPEDREQMQKDREENVKKAVALAEGERERRMSIDDKAKVQEDMVRANNVAAAKKAADEEQQARVQQTEQANVMAEVNRQASVESAKAAASGAQVEQVFETIMKQNSGVRWFVCKLTKNKKGLSNEGTGESWDSFVEAFQDSEVMWGVFAVHGVDERRSVVSVRTKPVSVCWVGPTVKPMKRMQALQGTRIFKDMLGGAVAVNVEATSKEDLDMKDIAVKIADCGGAHKPSHYDFSSMKLSLEDIGKSVSGDKY